MQEHTQLTQKEINEDLLKDVLGVPKWWLPAVLFLGFVVALGLGSFGFMVYHGLGVTGLNRPVMWGFFIANFVFCRDNQNLKIFPIVDLRNIMILWI